MITEVGGRRGPCRAALCACAVVALLPAVRPGEAEAQQGPQLSWDARSAGPAGAATSLLARGELAAASDSGPHVGVKLLRMRVSQGSTVKEITEAGAGLAALDFRGLPLEMGASIWLEGLSPKQIGGYVGVATELAKTDTLRIRLTRDPVWKQSAGVDPLRGLRVRDLRQIDWGLSATDVRVSLGSASTSRTSFHVEGGGTFHDDGNRRGFLAAELRVPVVQDTRLHVSFEPNAYVEHFARSTTGYLTPGGYASAGAEVGASAVLGPLALEASANPHVYRYPGFGGVGVAADFELSISTPRFAFGVWGELLHQGQYHFTQIGLGARVH